MTIFKVGDKVKINTDSEYFGVSPANPKDVEGVVELVREANTYKYVVLWPNTRANSYRDKDLALAKEHLYPHHDIIIDWLNGEEIQVKCKERWLNTVETPEASDELPCFNINNQYRIKPKNPHADEIDSIKEEMDKLSKRLEVLKDVS